MREGRWSENSKPLEGTDEELHHYRRLDWSAAGQQPTRASGERGGPLQEERRLMDGLRACNLRKQKDQPQQIVSGAPHLHGNEDHIQQEQQASA
jgi:hypothetical protein